MIANRIPTALVSILAWALAVSAVQADASWVTQADLIDAILERRSFTPQERIELDLNGDGSVDASDLICLQFDCHRDADFAAGQSTVDEGAGTALVTVQLELPVDGTLQYTIGGTATPDVDYVALGGTIAVNGTTAQIPISIIDDTELGEPLETVILTLVQASGYGLGATVQHRLNIVDNDAAWQGTLESEAGSVQFKLDLVHSPAGWTASLVGEAEGTYPPGQFPASVAFVPGTDFSADVDPIVMDASTTSFGVPITRTLELNPSDLGSTSLTVGPSYIFGEYRESLQAQGRPELTREIVGRFTLVRQETTLTASGPVGP
jgi:hypothetical protein